jgi:hypothetical protein
LQKVFSCGRFSLQLARRSPGSWVGWLTIETRAAFPHQTKKARPPYIDTCCGAEDEQNIIRLGTRALRQSERRLCETESVCNNVAVKSPSSTATRRLYSFRYVRCYDGSSCLYLLFVMLSFASTLLRIAALTPRTWLPRQPNTIRWTTHPFSMSTSQPSLQTGTFQEQQIIQMITLRAQTLAQTSSSPRRSSTRSSQHANMRRSYGGSKQAAVFC